MFRQDIVPISEWWHPSLTRNAKTIGFGETGVRRIIGGDLEGETFIGVGVAFRQFKGGYRGQGTWKIQTHSSPLIHGSERRMQNSEQGNVWAQTCGVEQDTLHKWQYSGSFLLRSSPVSTEKESQKVLPSRRMPCRHDSWPSKGMGISLLHGQRSTK